MNSALSARGKMVTWGAAHGVVVAESRFPGALAIEEHTHRTGYMSFTLAGTVVDSIAARDVPAAPGYSCYVPPGTPHANVFGASGAHCLLVEIDTAALEFLADVGSDVTTPWSGFDGRSAWRGFALYRVLRHDAVSSLDFEEFVHREFERRPAGVVKRPKPPSWLSRVRERLDAELQRPPSLAELARDADVHPMHLIRVFRTHSGCSPGEYVQTRRVARACRLLLDTEVPLARVALHLGYHDQSHFNRAFKARIGVAPGAYRRKDCPSRGDQGFARLRIQFPGSSETDVTLSADE